MNKVISVFKRVIDRVLVVFLAGVLVIASTACSGPASAGVAGTDRPGVSGEGKIHGNSGGYQTELYDPIQDQKGGMNEYSDVDPRLNTEPTAAKTRELLDNAEQTTVYPTESNKENLQRGLDRTRDLGNVVQEGTRDVSQRARETVDNVTGTVDQARKNVSKDSRRATEAASDYVQDKTNTAASRSQRTLDKAQDFVDRNLD
jgi:ElaB/YqjD/DUF883 family membrane-anchored ribosome-binding protein